MFSNKDELCHAAHELAMEYVRQNPPPPDTDTIDVEPYVHRYISAYREIISLLEKESSGEN